MQVKVNGKETETSVSNLAQLIEQLSLPQTGIAVAVNNTMVPQAKWADYALAEGMALTIIKAACGG